MTEKCACGFPFDVLPELIVTVCPKCGRVYRGREREIGRAPIEPPTVQQLEDHVPPTCPRCGALKFWQEVDDARHLIFRVGHRTRVQLGLGTVRHSLNRTPNVKFRCGRCGYEQDYTPGAYAARW